MGAEVLDQVVVGSTLVGELGIVAGSVEPGAGAGPDFTQRLLEVLGLNGARSSLSNRVFHGELRSGFDEMGDIRAGEVLGSGGNAGNVERADGAIHQAHPQDGFA